ncbi:MAG: hypothetical protein KF773_14825 [Deltaproteobacteria bacterium]|nr:hypothetical protein [Deltaproteobacteria bacterium]
MTAQSSGGVPAARDEDSGLHDIRSLASSQKMRLSRRTTQNPIIPDDDILASSSAGWKAVALPEPARMVSLPELAELPSKQEMKAREKAAKARESKGVIKPEPSTSVEASAPMATSAASAAVAAAVEPAADDVLNQVSRPIAVPPRVTPITAAKPKNTKVIAIAGVGLAAAAGIAIFVATQNNGGKSKNPSVAADQAAAPGAALEEKERSKKESAPPPPAPEKAQIAAATDEKAEGGDVKDGKGDDASGSTSNAIAPSETGAGSAAVPPPEQKLEKPAATPPTKKATPEKVTKDKGKEPVAKEPVKVEEKPTAPDPKTVGKKPEGKPGDPDFDALLKEAGVKDKPDAPKLEKKSLTMGEFKGAMAGIAGVAQKCYAGTQGTAMVRVSIAPSGKVQSVQVTGAFAGTPVGGCVESAVRSLSFPPWDGPPQSFGYSYLLAE